MGAAQRDPVSESFDRAARALLTRAYRARGGWASTRLADPSPAQLARWLLWGINVAGRDPVRGSVSPAPNRWARAFVRSVNYQHKWYSGDPDSGGWRQVRRASWRSPGVDVEFGRHRAVLGLIPAGYVVRVRYPAAGSRKRKPIPEGRRWADGGERWADPGDRDWAAFG